MPRHSRSRPSRATGRAAASAAVLALVAGLLTLAGAAPAAATTGLQFALRDSMSAGGPNHLYGFGPAGHLLPVLGDWDADGDHTGGVSLAAGAGRRHILTNYNRSSSPAHDFGWGSAGCSPIAGDWNGDGRTTLGQVCMHEPTNSWRWVMTDTNGPSGVIADFRYGNLSCTPVVGDWNGGSQVLTRIGVACDDGPDIVWNLRNSLSSGPAEARFTWGNAQCTPVTGDWDADGRSTPGVACPNRPTNEWRWLTTNTNGRSGVVDDFRFGALTSRPVTGDWNGDGRVTIGVVAGITAPPTDPPPGSTVAERAVSIARAQLGDPYEWGAEGPGSFDCSGLVWYAYQHAGHSWGRTTAHGQFHAYSRVHPAGFIDVSRLRVGDLVYWDWDHDGDIDHVGIYAGSDRFVEAPRPGVDVRERQLSTASPSSFAGANRPSP